MVNIVANIMRISFYSNFLQHHQIPFCNEMYRLLGDNFRFIATEQIDAERISLGYRDVSKDFPYTVNVYESTQAYYKAIRLGWESDVVIIGSAPDIFITERLSQDKLTFRYSERLFKRGVWRLLDPRIFRANLLQHTRYRNHQNLHMLCAGGYTARDAAIVGAYPRRCWKWGYFTEVKKQNLPELFTRKAHDAVKLLWVGRFLKLKHPEKAVMVMDRLKKSGDNCILDFIGIGEMEDKIKKMVREKELEDCVKFLGSMPSEKVREYMKRANIFLFTSDRQEGWGAVLNEAMNSGCAVVASNVIGSVPFLLQDGVNGLIYKNNSVTDLYKTVQTLVEDADLRKNLGQAAVRTMEETWNAGVAARRLIALCEKLLNNRPDEASELFQDGPCSKAL